MDDERLWERLVESLDAWTSASQVAPGRIEVALAGAGPERRAVIVMTPDEWDEMATVMWGDFDDAVADVKRTLGRLRRGERFAVYEQYRLEPSCEPTLPQDATAAHMEELLRRHPEGFGRWTAGPSAPVDDDTDRGAKGDG
jgi:hypothetical protein